MMLDILWRLVLVALVMAALLALAFFPWATDAPLTAANQAELQKYYATAYQQQNAATQPEADSKYVRIAEEAAARLNVKGAVEESARRYSLADKKVLDIGAGRGYLQDVVENYTGLDISPSARRFFHKKFVHASATYMPFPDGEFDAAWTIWVLEHVPNPEAALSEMRRVLKHHGLLLLGPAWDCTPWAAQGYPCGLTVISPWPANSQKPPSPFTRPCFSTRKCPSACCATALGRPCANPRSSTTGGSPLTTTSIGCLIVTPLTRWTIMKRRFGLSAAVTIA